LAATYLLEKALGTTRAREFCLLSPLIDAEEARHIGLVTRVCPDAELQGKTYELARRFAHGPGYALGQIKANLNAAYELPAEEATRREAESFYQCRQTSDHKEAARAFLEKRQPTFNRGTPID
jgi:2-(1,2-epoxy-1,2-dihydrophenyl)acetyl-CoA isomerase